MHHICNDCYRLNVQILFTLSNMLFDNKTSQDLSLGFIFQSNSLAVLMIFSPQIDQIFDINSDASIYEFVQDRFISKHMSIGAWENVHIFFSYNTDIIQSHLLLFLPCKWKKICLKFAPIVFLWFPRDYKMIGIAKQKKRNS